jgi:hypothetical protein
MLSFRKMPGEFSSILRNDGVQLDQMRSLLRFFAYSSTFNFLLAALILGTTGRMSIAASEVLYPAIRLAAAIIPTALLSDSGAANGVALILFSFLLNIMLCACVLALFSKLIHFARQRTETRKTGEST